MCESEKDAHTHTQTHTELERLLYTHISLLTCALTRLLAAPTPPHTHTHLPNDVPSPRLDTVASVWLNGAKVGTANDQFRRYMFDITYMLHHDGSNTLEVRFSSMTQACSYPDKAKWPGPDGGKDGNEPNGEGGPDCYNGWSGMDRKAPSNYGYD